MRTRLRQLLGWFRTNAHLRRQIDQLAGVLAGATADRDDARRQRAAAQVRAADAEAERFGLASKLRFADAEVARLRVEVDRLLAQNHDLAGRVDTLLADRAAADARVNELTAERDRFGEMLKSLMERVAAQSELLGKAAGGGGPQAGRVAELEAALAPFAQVLLTGWDTGSLPADAPYPVALGDLRRAARVLAGTRPPLRVAEGG